MPSGTRTRPVKPKKGKPGITVVSKARKRGCGAWFITFIPYPPKLVTKTLTVTLPDKTKERRRRWSLDNIIYFFPNLENQCNNYAFIQFAKRRAFNTKNDGSNRNRNARHSHDWEPDNSDWKKRTVKKFIDPKELIYDKDLVTKVRPKGFARRDGPGVVHPFGRPPKNLRICWEFKTYVVCDDVAKVVGYIEFSFCIYFDKKGKAHLEFPKAGKAGSPKLTEVCCRYQKEFYQWIDQWHLHTPLKRMPKDDAKRKNKMQELKTLIQQASESTNPLFELVEADDVPCNTDELEAEQKIEPSNYTESNTVYYVEELEKSLRKKKSSK